MNCHYKGGKDLISLYYNENPNTKLFNGKHLIASGSLNTFTGNKLLLVIFLPLSCNTFHGGVNGEGHQKAAKLISIKWDDKLNYICETSSRDDIHLVAGVLLGYL